MAFSLTNRERNLICMNVEEHYRAASWWLTWKDLAWPDDDIADDIKRRADLAAKSGVNCAVIFGAHFRWDFMPLWMNLHDLMSFIGNELHQRGIMLFDHHSSVLTHRYSTQEAAQAMRLYNRHHVPFAPSRDVASEWTYKGKKLDDWRMTDLTSGKPVFLDRYTAEQFCMNNPDFQNAYYDYVKRLLTETNIDGLMSDDGIYYSGWTTCGCEWCRKEFRQNYGHEVPPVSDTSFWGNYQNEAFKDWIELRFGSTRKFLEGVRKVVGKDFRLMTCCSNSVASSLTGYGMTYQEFIKPCDHIMLEMCGNTPSLDGGWHSYFPVQMLHIGIGRENNAPCLGLGYGFTEATADFIWSFNKFLGAGTWFSTLKGRLGLPDSKMASLKDDTELSGNGFNWEKENPEILDAATDSDVAVFFSRWSRDYYSMTEMDYVNDYKETCFDLLRQNITFDVVTVIPKASAYKVLLLCGTSCLDPEEYLGVNQYLRDGGVIIGSGPVGCYDKRGNKAAKPWLEQFGITCAIDEPERMAAFLPCSKQKEVVPACQGIYEKRQVGIAEWITINHGKGRLLWAPGRMQSHSKELAIDDLVRGIITEKVIFPHHDCGWKFRMYKKSASTVIHAMAEKFEVGCMDELEKLRKSHMGNNLINSVSRHNSVTSAITLQLMNNYTTAVFYAPLNDLKSIISVVDGRIDLKISDDVYYFIMELK